MSTKSNQPFRSSIFLADVSVVDHAYINNKGQVIGGSFNPGFIISGEVDSTEKVVVDFSTIKKDVKTAIDFHGCDIYANGFDHKIWFIEGYSNATITNNVDSVSFDSVAFTGTVPADAVRFIAHPETSELSPDYSLEYIGQALATHVYNELISKYPNIDLKVECRNTVNTHTMSDMPLSLFTYSHGLKDSTSYGCQNLFHGHLSYLQYKDEMITAEVAADLNNTVFINPENVVHDNQWMVAIEYTTPRGLFKATYNKDQNKVVILKTESTVEFLAEYVRDKYGITDFYISEGLSKGTVL